MVTGPEIPKDKPVQVGFGLHPSFIWGARAVSGTLTAAVSLGHRKPRSALRAFWE